MCQGDCVAGGGFARNQEQGRRLLLDVEQHGGLRVEADGHSVRVELVVLCKDAVGVQDFWFKESLVRMPPQVPGELERAARDAGNEGVRLVRSALKKQGKWVSVHTSGSERARHATFPTLVEKSFFFAHM